MMQSSGIRFQTVTTFIIGDLSVGAPYSNGYQIKAYAICSEDENENASHLTG